MRKITHTAIELIADDGMLLTDGDRYCKAVFLPYDDSGEAWKEIPESEKPVEEEDASVSEPAMTVYDYVEGE